MYKQGNNLLRKVWPLFIVAMIALLAVSGYSALNPKSTVSAVAGSLTLNCSELSSSFANNAIIVVQAIDTSGQIVESHYYNIKAGTTDGSSTATNNIVFSNLQQGVDYSLYFMLPSFSELTIWDSNDNSFETNYFQFTMGANIQYDLVLNLWQDSWFSDTTVV